MRTARAFAPALGAGLLFTFGSNGEKIAFQPDPGATAQKSFTIGGEYSLDSLSLVVDGQDIAGMIGSVDVNVKQETKIEITDVYKSLAEGRPKELLRTFDALTGSMHMDITPVEAAVPEMNSSSDLEGKTVSFLWNDEKGEFDLAFHESEGDAELLEDLSEDMDLRAFLPGKEVAEDDTWTVELKSLGTVAMPGGNLHLTPEGVDVDGDDLEMFEELFGDLGDKFSELLEGECTCTFEGVREEKDARLAEISIKVEVHSALDLSEFLEKAIKLGIEKSGGGAGVEFTIDSADLNLDFEGTGTLLWDLKAGRLHSFQLGGDVTIGIDLGVNVEAEGESHSLDASVEMQGSMHEDIGTKE